MANGLRPIDNRFQINGVSMPKPHEVKVNIKWMNSEASTDVNTGDTILNPLARKVESVWKYVLLREDQYQLIYNQVFQAAKANYNNKTFKSWNPNTNRSISYLTYEPDNFETPEVKTFIRDGVAYKFYLNVEFHFTSEKAGSIVW